jgi:XrtJ-associated TM-motif-TM protein
MIRRSAVFLALFFCAALIQLHAQSGCVDSPESPTVVLALIGGIALVAGSIRSARANKE